MEDPLTGTDLGRAGAFSWHDPVPAEVSTSYQKAMVYGKYDSEGGGHYYWDAEENLWWSWDTADVIAEKFPRIMEEKGLGGAFAWGLGEDAEDFSHLKVLTAEMKNAFGERGYQGAAELNTPSSSSATTLSSSRYKDEL